MDSVVEAAKAEEQRLLAELLKHPTYLKLEAIRNLLQLYEHDASEDSIATVTSASTQNFVARTFRQNSIVSQVRALVLPYLRNKGSRAQTGELLKIMTDNGVVIGGQKPSATLSSYLSSMDGLDHVRGEGYGLSSWSSPSHNKSDTSLNLSLSNEESSEVEEQATEKEHSTTSNHRSTSS